MRRPGGASRWSDHPPQQDNRASMERVMAKTRDFRDIKFFLLKEDTLRIRNS